jgi:DNA replication protein DnaC
MKRLSRAYAIADTIEECGECHEGKVVVMLCDETEYNIPCPLLNLRCEYGQRLRNRLDAHALSWVKSLPGVPTRFHEQLGQPKPTAAIRGVNMWNHDRQCFLLLHGEHGTGKSFAAAYALYVIARSKLLSKWRYPSSWGGLLNAMWVSAYRVTTKDELYETARGVPILVIDDLGSEENTSRAKSRLTEIVAERYNHRRSTVLTTNADSLELEKIYGDRMADRVIGAGYTVHCGGESLRLAG